MTQLLHCREGGPGSLEKEENSIKVSLALPSRKITMWGGTLYLKHRKHHMQSSYREMEESKTLTKNCVLYICDQIIN